MNLTKALAALGIIVLVYLFFRVGAFVMRIILALAALGLIVWLLVSWLGRRGRRR